MPGKFPEFRRETVGNSNLPGAANRQLPKGVASSAAKDALKAILPQGPKRAGPRVLSGETSSLVPSSYSLHNAANL